MSDVASGVDRPELYVGLCGAAGTDLGKTCRLLEQEFHGYGYSAKTIVLSEIFAKLERFSSLASLQDESERLNGAMDAGNEIRRLAGPDAPARLAVAEIRHHREERNEAKSADDPLPGTVYIIKSLKHPAEFELLSKLYKDAFVLISVYESRAERVKNLARRIAQRRKVPIEECAESASDLVDRDEFEAGVESGQDVRGVFPLADIFVEAGLNGYDQIRRLARIIFGAPFMTPRREEFGMYHAHAAALKSADLSRQVGAVILTRDSEIVSSGCNDVPKVGGGVIWGEDVSAERPDRRDYALGFDSSAKMKRKMLREVVSALKAGGWLADEKSSTDTESLVDELLSRRSPASLRNARITNVIEFGRIVHAEMSALMDAARRGHAVKGLTLYCTTFPCHMCARHIIAAGLRRVVYIEPYPKSMAKELYQEEILVDAELSTDLRGVRFEPFVGVSPRRYAEWFTMGQRKDSEGWALPDVGESAKRKVARNLFLPPAAVEAGYEESLSVLFELDQHTPGAANDKGQLATDESVVGKQVNEQSIHESGADHSSGN